MNSPIYYPPSSFSSSSFIPKYTYTTSSACSIVSQNIRQHFQENYPLLSKDDVQRLLLDTEELARTMYLRLVQDAAQVSSNESIPVSTLLYSAQQYHENLLRNIDRIILLSPDQLFPPSSSSSLPVTSTLGQEKVKRTKIMNNHNSNNDNDTNTPHPFSQQIYLPPSATSTPITASSVMNFRGNNTTHTDSTVPSSSSSAVVLFTDPPTLTNSAVLPFMPYTGNSSTVTFTTGNTARLLPFTSSVPTSSTSTTTVLVPTLKRANLTDEQKAALREWFIHHIDHPYPTEKDKEDLAHQIFTTVERVSNWFINARAREWEKLRSLKECTG